MKREIKFRAWDGVLHEYRTIDMNSGKQNLGMGFESTEGIGSNTTTIYHSFGDVIEQYTGLKDANGKEIYEGDIVESGLEYPRIFVIAWSEGDAAFVAGSQKIFYVAKHGKILGNIHENAELLEVD